MSYPSSSSPPSSYPYKPSNPALYPGDAWISLAVVLAIVGLFQWGSVLYSKFIRRRRPSNGVDEESTEPSAQGTRTRRGFARLPLAAVNVFRVVAFRWTLDWGSYHLTVTDIVLTLAYIAFLVAWMFIGDGLGVKTFDVIGWSGRAGVLAASQFPFVTALGTKNNIVSLVTGIGYEKLNYLHRVTARACFALLLVHVGGKIYSTGSSLDMLLQESWLRWGITAIVSLAILFVVSLRPVRTRVYEVFFYMHFVAVFIFLLGAYFHTRQTSTSYWIWPAFMFWGLDRLMRVARIVAGNHLYFGFSRRKQLQDATIELLSDEFVRVRVRRPRHFQWSAGQTAYLIMPSVSKFPLEAHPFSIASIDSALFQTGGDSGTDDWKELVFLINVRHGFTKRLKRFATRNQTTKVFIDGPYGLTPDMTAPDTSIFVAGGSGITYTLPVFLGLIGAARRGSCRCRRVVFIWVVRDASQVQWISDALVRANALTPAWLTVSIRIYATRGSIPSSEINSIDSESAPDKEVVQDWSALSSFVSLESGRPNLPSILRSEVNMATGSLSVAVCGSQSLTQSVRHGLRFPVSGPSSVLDGGPSVTLHVESFGYA